MSSIRRSIVLSVSITALLVCSAAFPAVYLAVRHQLYSQFDVALLTRAEALAGLIQVERGRIEVDLRDEGFLEYRRMDRPAYFAVLDDRGKVLARSESLGQRDLTTGGIEGEGPIERGLRLPDGRPGRMVAIRAIPERQEHDEDERHRAAPTETPPTVWVVVAADTAAVTDTLAQLAVAFAAAFGIIMIALLLIVPRLVGRGLAPLNAMASKAASIDATNLSTRFPSKAIPSEIQPIADQLNASLDRLAGAFERERRFAGNAAHELRTPLAAIRANAEVALKWPEQAQLAASMQDVLTSATRMQSLVDRLLELSRLGTSSAPLPMTPIDLPLLIDAALSDVGPIIAERKLRVALDTDRPLYVASHPDLLPSLVGNVVANAARHAKEGAEICITLRARPRVEWIVANRTDDLAEDDLGQLFTPLWTKSVDRSRPGTGLGLALVAEYARVLGITVSPQLEPKGWFRLKLGFPAPAQ